MKCAILIGLASCSFDHGALPPGSTARIVDDSAQELAAGTATDLAIDPLGYLAPDAFIAGGLHARGYLSTPVTLTTTSADLTPDALGPISGERYGEPPTVDWSTDRPYGLGLARADDFTVVYDGEIYLDGPVQLRLAADDVGFLEIELGAISVTLRATYDNASPAVAIQPPAPGWYPIRGAMSEGVGYASMIVSTVDGGGTATPVDASRFRARVTTAPGLMVSAAQSRVFAAPIAGEAIEPSLIDHAFGYGPPSYDFYGLTANEYALRYAGQVRIDHDGLYGFAIAIGGEPGDYARLMIDGQTVAGQWPGQVDQLTVPGVQLAAGWHDLILDYAQYVATATVQLTMVTPGGSGPIPGDHLRPVRTGGLIAYASAASAILVDASAAPGVTTVPFTITAPDDAVVDFGDLLFLLSGETRTDLAVELDHGTGIDPMPLPAKPAYDAIDDYLGAHTALAGSPPGGAWSAVFTDNVPGGPQGTVSGETLIVSYHGGPGAPFAQQMTYVSAIHPTPGATAIGPIMVTADLHGATLQLEVRTSGDWVPVANGAAPAVTAGETVQYRLTLTSDGWHAPTIDRIELDYSAT